MGTAHGRARRTAQLATAATVAMAAMLPAAAHAALSTPPARTWGTNGRVLAILPIGDRVFVGGTFTQVVDTSGVKYSVKNLAVFSASTGRADLTFQAGTNGQVNAIASNGGTTLFLGGLFTTVSNGATTYTRNGLAAVSANTGVVNGWAPSPSGGVVDQLAYASATSSVYVGGNFAALNGSSGTTSPNGFLAKVNATTGAVDTAFTAAPNDRVRALNVAADGTNRLFVGGDFASVSSTPKTKSLAALNLATGAVDTTFQSGPNNGTAFAPVYDVTSDASRVYVAAGGSGGACAAFDRITGATTWSVHSNGNMQAVRVVGASLYCGGHFGGTASFGGLSRNKLAQVDPATGAIGAFSPRVNSALGTWALGAQAGDPNLYLGGDFTAVNGMTQLHFAVFVDSTLQSVPQAPANLLAQPGNGSVELTWSVPSSNGGKTITGYQVFRSEVSGGQNLGAPLATVGAGSVAFTDASVTNGTKYFYVVTATNVLGSSAPSLEANARPSSGIVLTAPSAPTAVAATNPPGKVSLTWNPPTSNGGAPVVSYRIYRGTTPGGQGSTPWATDVTGTTFDDTYGLVPGATFYYKITAVNSVGEGAVSTEVSAVAQAGPPAKMTMTAAVVANGIKLTWPTPGDGGSPITKYVLLRDAVKLVANVNPALTTYTDTTAQVGVTYAYQIKAVNAQGSSPLSNKVTITR